MQVLVSQKFYTFCGLYRNYYFLTSSFFSGGGGGRGLNSSGRTESEPSPTISQGDDDSKLLQSGMDEYSKRNNVNSSYRNACVS